MPVDNLPKLTSVELLARAADILPGSNANGVDEPQEVQALLQALRAKEIPVVEPGGFLDLFRRLAPEKAHLLQATQALATHAGATKPNALPPGFARLPAALRHQALTLDGLWGDGSGRLGPALFAKVATFYHSALPFFAADGQALLALAARLNVPKTPAMDRLADALKSTPELDTASQKARDLFDEAVALAEVPGAPGLLRDPALHSPRWHEFGILQHSGFAVGAMAALTAWANGDNNDSKGYDLDADMLGQAMLLHDVGKILSRRREYSGWGWRYRYTDHEADGARWLADKGLKHQDVLWHVANHMRLRGASVDELITLCGADKKRVAEFVLVYCADQLAKGRTPDQLLSFAEQESKIAALSEFAGLDSKGLFATIRALRNDLLPAQKTTPG